MPTGNGANVEARTLAMKKPRPAAATAQQDQAIELAIAALGFLGGDEERLARFLALTGLGPQSLRAAAREPGFLIAVLDHVASEEELLLAFADEQGIDPQDVERARGALAGRAHDTGAA
jgi:hypothetical protein